MSYIFRMIFHLKYFSGVSSSEYRLIFCCCESEENRKIQKTKKLCEKSQSVFYYDK